MSKARELAELGDTLTVDGSGNIDITGTVTADGLTVEATASGSNVSVASLQNDGSGANTKADLDFFAANTKYATISGGYGASSPELNLKVGSPPALAMTINGSGNVGIGTAAPSLPLSVDGDIWQGNTGGVEIGRITNNAGWYDFGASSNVNGAQMSHPAIVRFNTAGTERMRLDASGNVGIGTSSPSYKLDTNNGGASAAAIRVAGNDQANVRLRLENSGAGGRTWEVVGGRQGTENSSFSIYDATSSATRMLIDASGNVGIGTATPNVRLEVAGPSGQMFLNNTDATGNGSHEFKMTALKAGTGFNVLTLGGWEQRFNIGGAQGEAMRIDSSGNLYVGATSTTLSTVGGRMLATGEINAITNATAAFNARRLTSNGDLLRFFNTAGGSVGTISTTASTTAYNTSSDYRLKENITPVQGAADIVKAMRPVTYNFKEDLTDWHDGFIAHELQELHPRAVSGEKDAMRNEEYEVTPAVEATYDAEGVELTPAEPAVMGTRSVPDYQGVDYSKLTPILTAALQEALNKIDALEARLTVLEGTV